MKRECYNGARSNLDASTLRLVKKGCRVVILRNGVQIAGPGGVTKTCGGRAWVCWDSSITGSVQLPCSLLTVQ